MSGKILEPVRNPKMPQAITADTQEEKSEQLNVGFEIDPKKNVHL